MDSGKIGFGAPGTADGQRDGTASNFRQGTGQREPGLPDSIGGYKGGSSAVWQGFKCHISGGGGCGGRSDEERTPEDGIDYQCFP